MSPDQDRSQPRAPNASRTLLGVMVMAWWRSSRAVVGCALLAAIVGVAAWAAVDRLGDLARIALDRSAAGGALPAVVVGKVDGVDPVLVAQLLQPPVRAVLPRQIGFARLRAGERQLQVVVLGLELATEAMARPRRLGVAMATPAPGHARLLLDGQSAALLDLVAGDDVQLVGDGEAVAATVAAVLDASGAEDALVGVAIVELDAARRVLQRVTLDQLELLLDPDRVPADQAVRLRSRLGEAFTVDAVERRTDPGASEALRTTWRMGGLMTLLFAVMALAAAIADQVRANRRRRELLHALGASPRLLVALVVVPAAGLALLAVIGGVLLGDLAVPWLRRGAEAWVELQTGVAARLEVVPRSPTAWLWLVVTTSVTSIGCALCCERLQVRGQPRRDNPSVRLGRLWAAALALVLVLLLAHSETVLANRWLRVLDLVAGVAAVAFATPPLVVCFGRCFVTRATESATRLLAAARIRERPGSLLDAARLCAIAVAIAVALMAIVTSLRSASSVLVAHRVPGDLIATSVGSWLGIGQGGDRVPMPLQDTLRASPLVRSVDAIRRPGALAVELVDDDDVPRTARELLSTLPAGSLLVDAARMRARLLRASEPALGTIETMIWLLAVAAGLTVMLLWWLDDLRDAAPASLLRTIGGSRSDRLRVRAWLALWCGLGAASAGVAGGVLLGHAWTRGPLATVLGFDCAFTMPVAVMLLAPVVVVAWLQLASLLGSCLASPSRTGRG